MKSTLAEYNLRMHVQYYVEQSTFYFPTNAILPKSRNAPFFFKNMAVGYTYLAGQAIFCQLTDIL